MAVNQRPCDAFYRATVQLAGRREGEQGFDPRVAPEDEPPKTRASAERDMKVTLGDIK